MKNNFAKIIGTLMLMFTSSYAEIAYTNILLGVEGGYTLLDHKYTQANGAQNSGSTDFMNFGLKAGAETETMRTLFNVNYYSDPSELYDYLITYGLEVQYKFFTVDMLNMYLGLGGGFSHTKVSINGESSSRKIDTPYVGASLGSNIHLGNSFDLELGARVNAIQSQNDMSGGSYKLGNIVTGYASLFYKWNLN